MNNIGYVGGNNIIYYGGGSSSSGCESGTWGIATAVTISTGIIAVTGPGMYVVTSEGAAADDLITITGGSEGDEIILYSVDSANTITVKHGTDNIQIGFDYNLNNLWDQIRLTKRSDGNWVGGGINDNS